MWGSNEEHIETVDGSNGDDGSCVVRVTICFFELVSTACFLVMFFLCIGGCRLPLFIFWVLLLLFLATGSIKTHPRRLLRSHCHLPSIDNGTANIRARVCVRGYFVSTRRSTSVSNRRRLEEHRMVATLNDHQTHDAIFQKGIAGDGEERSIRRRAIIDGDDTREKCNARDGVATRILSRAGGIMPKFCNGSPCQAWSAVVNGRVRYCWHVAIMTNRSPPVSGRLVDVDRLDHTPSHTPLHHNFSVPCPPCSNDVRRHLSERYCWRWRAIYP